MHGTGFGLGGLLQQLTRRETARIRRLLHYHHSSGCEFLAPAILVALGVAPSAFRVLFTRVSQRYHPVTSWRDKRSTFPRVLGQARVCTVANSALARVFHCSVALACSEIRRSKGTALASTRLQSYVRRSEAARFRTQSCLRSLNKRPPSETVHLPFWPEGGQPSGPGQNYYSCQGWSRAAT